MEAALRAIAEPRRRRILQLVRERELSAGAIASQFDVTRPAISQHLGVLKEAGLVDERRNGTQRLYRARPQGLSELKTFLDGFWDAKLEALQREAEREERKRTARGCASCTAGCGTRSRRPRTRTAGTTTSSGSPSRRRAASSAPIRGLAATCPKGIQRVRR